MLAQKAALAAFTGNTPLLIAPIVGVSGGVVTDLFPPSPSAA